MHVRAQVVEWCFAHEHMRQIHTHFADVVEVTVGCSLLTEELLVCVQHDVQVELLLQQDEPVMHQGEKLGKARED